MSITSELKDFVDGLACHKSTRDMLREIADRIDQEHERATTGCIHYDPERHYCSVHGDTEHGWVRLPVDAEGVPFHVGDRVEVPDGPPDAGRPNVRGMIVALKLGVVTWHIHVKLPNGNTTRHLVENVRHAYAPTVEDVTCEFLQDLSDWLGLELDIDYIKADDLFAEYAAKLRLAGEE